MDEATAKTKWCPFARTKTTNFSGAADAGTASANRDFDGVPIDRLHTCMGSACMAWRTTEGPPGAILDRVLMTDSKEMPEGFTGGAALETDTKGFWRSFWVKREPPVAHGYCGLAGHSQ